MTTVNEYKDVRIGFFHGVTAQSEREEISTIGDVLGLIANETLPRPNIPVSNATSRELRVVQREHDVRGYSGIFAKFQHGDLPTIAAPAGDERSLELLDEEGLLEKLFFLYVPEFNVLVCRVTGTASPLGNYLSAAYAPNFGNKAVSFSPVIQPSAWDRLMADEALLQSVEMKIARPTNPEMLPDDPWSRNVLGMFSESEGAVITIKMAAELRRTNNSISLPSRLKQTVKNWMDVSSDIKSAKIGISTEREPVDLFRDRITSTYEVAMNGRYLSQRHMSQVLKDAYREHEDEIRMCFSNSN